MNTTLYQNRPGETYNWTNLHLEPHDYQIYHININLRHQYGIYVAESETFLLAKLSQWRRARRNGCFRRLLWTLDHRSREQNRILVLMTSCLFFFKSGPFVKYDVSTTTNTWLSKNVPKISQCLCTKKIIVNLEDPGIDPGTSRMLSGRSTIWANPPASNYKPLGKI